MSRKNLGKSSAKKHSAVPPKAAPRAASLEAIKLEIPAAPEATVATHATVAADQAVVTAAITETPVAEAATAPTNVPATLAARELAADSEFQVLLADFQSADAAVRATAATALGKSTAAAAVPALIAGLHDSDADVAREIATALGTFAAPAAVEPLIEVLNNVDGYFHCVVRAAAAIGLGQSRDTRAIEPLLTAITDPIAEVSVEAIRALGALGDASVVNVLIDVIRNRADFFLPIARHAAVLALAQLGGEQAAAELQSVATDGWENPVVRDAAHTAIGSISATAAN